MLIALIAASVAAAPVRAQAAAGSAENLAVEFTDPLTPLPQIFVQDRCSDHCAFRLDDRFAVVEALVISLYASCAFFTACSRRAESRSSAPSWRA